MEFISVFDEASRDIEAEARERHHTAATQEATQAVWEFVALAKSEQEFDHRLALVEDRLTSIASTYDLTLEEVQAPLRQGYAALHPKVAEAEHCYGSGTQNLDGSPCPSCGHDVSVGRTGHGVRDPHRVDGSLDEDATNKVRRQRYWEETGHYPKDARKTAAAGDCGYCGGDHDDRMHKGDPHYDSQVRRELREHSASRKTAMFHKWIGTGEGDESQCIGCGVVAPDHGEGVMSDYGDLPITCPGPKATDGADAHHFTDSPHGGLECAYCGRGARFMANDNDWACDHEGSTNGGHYASKTAGFDEDFDAAHPCKECRPGGPAAYPNEAENDHHVWAHRIDGSRSNLGYCPVNAGGLDKAIKKAVTTLGTGHASYQGQEYMAPQAKVRHVPGYDLMKDTSFITDPVHRKQGSRKIAAAEASCDKCKPGFMAPGSVIIQRRPDKGGRYDVNQIWGLTSYTRHQGHDYNTAREAAEQAHQEALTGVEENRAKYGADDHEGGGHARIYDTSIHSASRKTAAACGCPNGSEGEHLGDCGHRGGYARDDYYRDPYDAYDDHYAMLKQALAEGVNPLDLAAQMGMGGGQQESHHMETQVLTGGGSAMDAAMSGGGSSAPQVGHQTQPELTGGGSAGQESQVGGGQAQPEHQEAPNLTGYGELPQGSERPFA